MFKRQGEIHMYKKVLLMFLTLSMIAGSATVLATGLQDKLEVSYDYEVPNLYKDEDYTQLNSLIFDEKPIYNAYSYSETNTNMEQLSLSHQPEQFITTANLNLRPSPNTSGDRLMLVPPGHRVNVLDSRDGVWFYVEYNGIFGYMYSRYLRMPSPPLQPGEVGRVELLHWDYARHYMTIGVAATIIDVRTGLTWQVASFSNGRHADVETLTAEDTAIMLQAFGGRWDWQPRPVVVVINGRSIAASINGMPHAQQTRTGNNMNGHVCLHFYGSTTHNTNRATHHSTIVAAQTAFDLLNRAVPVLGGTDSASTLASRAAGLSSVIANPSNATVFVDGVEVSLVAYNIDGHNFFRLRDIAFVLNGSSSQFNLYWSAEHQAILIIRGIPYQVVGNELVVEETLPTLATPTRAAVFLDAVEVNPRAYTIAGTNYFMLAELAEMLGFSAGWDGDTRAIWISTLR